ncbi:hypothetical protein [Hyphomicrobium sp.]|jgi:hypothetical protein|uniref:hypothetical protein n=1 Tax=Hyphomicrobium sp. TaxID=82 RepID=UPI00356211EC
MIAARKNFSDRRRYADRYAAALWFADRRARRLWVLRWAACRVWFSPIAEVRAPRWLLRAMSALQSKRTSALQVAVLPPVSLATSA